MNCGGSRDVYVKIFLRRMIALPLADSLRVACCWRIRESSLRKCSSCWRSFAWRRKSISCTTSAVTVLLMSFFNTVLFSLSASRKTSPTRARTCSTGRPAVRRKELLCGKEQKALSVPESGMRPELQCVVQP